MLSCYVVHVGVPLNIITKIWCAQLTFLTDTDSSLSILLFDQSSTPLLRPTLPPTTVTLTTASGYKIKVYGEVEVEATNSYV